MWTRILRQENPWKSQQLRPLWFGHNSSGRNLKNFRPFIVQNSKIAKSQSQSQSQRFSRISLSTADLTAEMETHKFGPSRQLLYWTCDRHYVTRSHRIAFLTWNSCRAPRRPYRKHRENKERAFRIQFSGRILKKKLGQNVDPLSIP